MVEIVAPKFCCIICRIFHWLAYITDCINSLYIQNNSVYHKNCDFPGISHVFLFFLQLSQGIHKIPMKVVIFIYLFTILLLLYR